MLNINLEKEMINKNILKAVLMAATKESKDAVIYELLNHISYNYDYNDEKAGHVLAMLVDKSEVVTIDKVNIEWLQFHLEKLIYQADKYKFKDIRPVAIDNIESSIKVEFKVLEKINEDRDDVSYRDTYTWISFIDNPEVLK